MSVGDRVKALRKSNNLSRDAFAASLGVSRDVIANIELHRISNIESKSPLLHLMCEKYSCRPEWLLHGTGEMLEDVSRDEEIITAVSEIFDGDDQFKKDLIGVLVKLPEAHWAVLSEIAEQLLQQQEERNKKDQGD